MRLDNQVNWDEVAGILKDGYLMSAPKKLGGSPPSMMDQAASMSDIATKRRSANNCAARPFLTQNPPGCDSPLSSRCGWAM